MYYIIVHRRGIDSRIFTRAIIIMTGYRSINRNRLQTLKDRFPSRAGNLMEEGYQTRNLLVQRQYLSHTYDWSHIGSSFGSLGMIFYMRSQEGYKEGRGIQGLVLSLLTLSVVCVFQCIQLQIQSLSISFELWKRLLFYQGLYLKCTQRDALNTAEARICSTLIQAT